MTGGVSPSAAGDAPDGGLARAEARRSGEPPPLADPGRSAEPTEPVEPVEPDDGWRRLHPATPLLRGGVVLLAILVWAVVQLRDVLISLVLGDLVGGRIPEDPAARWILSHAGLALGIVALVLVGILLIGWLSWRMHSYRITSDVVEEREGLIWRKHRRARLDRIQGVNVERPILARIFGAARLEIAVAGEDANIKLSYLRSGTTNALRDEILAAASRARAGEAGGTAVAHSSPERATGLVGQRLQELTAPEFDATLRSPGSIVRMDLGRLIASTVLSIIVPLVLASAAILVPVIAGARWGVLFILIPVIIAFLAYAFRRVSRSLRYSIAATPDGIRVGFGLLSTTNETLPAGRIHAIEVTQPLLWRPFGWWSVRINRASRSTRDGAGGQAATTILPIGDADDVARVIGLILPGLDLRGAFGADGPRIVGATGGEPMSADAPEPSPGYVTSPARARPFRWFSWRRNGYALAPEAVLLRKGAIWRTLTIVPLARVQSVAITSGPLARAARLRRIAIHTVAGAIAPTIGALDVADAERLWDEVETRALDAIAVSR